VIVFVPLWQRVTFVSPLPPPFGVAKATVTVPIIATVIITITLRIETLRLTRIMPPCTDGGELSLSITSDRTIVPGVAPSGHLGNTSVASVTTEVSPRIRRMAIFWTSARGSMAGNARRLFLTSEPSTQQLWSYFPPSNPHFSRAQAMYACIRQIGRRLSEGVCPPSNATAHLRDPPFTAPQVAKCPWEARLVS
jgi:hypothetical protein